MERQWFNGKVKCLLGVVAWLTSNCNNAFVCSDCPTFMMLDCKSTSHFRRNT